MVGLAADRAESTGCQLAWESSPASLARRGGRDLVGLQANTRRQPDSSQDLRMTRPLGQA